MRSSLKRQTYLIVRISYIQALIINIEAAFNWMFYTIFWNIHNGHTLNTKR